MVTKGQYDAVIIGAGIIGSSTAYALSQRGYRVLVVDRNPAAGYGSTSSSSAVIRTFYTVRASTQLAWEGLHCWQDFAAFLEAGPEDGPLAGYTETGCVVLRDGAPDGMDAACAHHDSLGIPYEAWDEATLAAKLPICDLRRFGPPKRIDDPAFGDSSGARLTALYFPKGGYVNDPQLAARNLADAARRRGATFRFRTGFKRLCFDAQGRVSGIETDTGEIVPAPVVVNAGGPHASIINKAAGAEAGMRVRTRPLRQEVCHLPVPDGYQASRDGYMIGDPDSGIYLRPDGTGHLLVGGMEPDCDPLVWLDDPDALDRNLTEQWTQQAWRAALRFPSLGIPGQAQGVADLYDVADDWTPIYDKSDLPGFYLACGTSGNQFKNGCIAGQAMAALIDWCEAGHDHDADPCILPLANTGGVLDLSAFSRLREAAGGGSVLG